jgi:hypothetical protein
MRNYCTLFDQNYLAKGLALYRSMELYVGEFFLHILALDNETERLLRKQSLSRACILNLSSLVAENSAVLVAQGNRTPQEFAWTLGSVWLERCVREVGDCTYLDADSYFFSDPMTVFREIGEACAAIPPHRYSPGREGGYANGIYNVNFVYCSVEGLPFAKEWASLCLDWCYYKHSLGRFGDQKYFDTLVPKYRIHSIRHLGCNLAPWNQLQYVYGASTEEVGPLCVEGYPVVLYHFHEFKHDTAGKVLTRTGWKLDPTIERFLYLEYETRIREVCRSIYGT